MKQIIDVKKVLVFVISIMTRTQVKVQAAAKVLCRGGATARLSMTGLWGEGEDSLAWHVLCRGGRGCCMAAFCPTFMIR